MSAMELIYPVENPPKKLNGVTTQHSNIQRYFSGTTVFITGATGFLGRLLIEKLLRTCRGIERIYILMRPKKDKSCEKRFEEFFNDIIYDRVKQEYPKALEKVYIISGDCGLPDLGINEKDRRIITSEVNCIFHVAATVRFDEKIRTASNINVRGTRDILRMAKQTKNLTSMVYVSTAYSFCPQQKIGEKFYQPMITGEQLMTTVETLSEDKLDELTPTLLGKWPNTYVFTKAIAEDVVKREGFDLPIAVVRPSIVVGTAKEPIPGWIDNFYGATGVIAGAGLGLIRTLHCKPDNLADLVPADYVINNFIAAAWDIANTKGLNLNKEVADINKNNEKEGVETNIPIYNYVSSPQRPLTWRKCMDLGFERGDQIVSSLLVWHHCLQLNPNKYVHLILHYLMHILPAYIVDFFALCLRKQPQLVKGYAKISKFLDVIAFFSTQEWVFENHNTQELWKKLNYEDRKAFDFDMHALDWRTYFQTYITGIRVYVVKDPMDTVPKGLAKAFRLKILHYTLVTILILVFLNLLLTLWNAVV